MALSPREIERLVNDGSFVLEGDSESELELDDDESSDRDFEQNEDDEVDESDQEDEDNPQPIAAGTWRGILNTNEEPDKIPFQPQRVGFTARVGACKEAKDFFELFFDNSLLVTIVEETNRYANEIIQKAAPIGRHSQWYGWIDVTIQELKVFFAVIMNMSLNEKPTIDHYFNQEGLYKQDFFTAMFTRRRFYQIYRSFHLAPPLPPRDRSLKTRGHKVQNIVDHVDRKFREMFSPKEDISIDESTIGFKGRIIFKMYNPQKPTKWGIRVYTVADSATGYIVGFVPYFGKPTTDSLVRPELPFTSRIVLHLMQKLQSDCGAKGRHVFTDRFYTSPNLASELLLISTHTTGTVMANRQNLPPEVSLLLQIIVNFYWTYIMKRILFYQVKGKQTKKLKKGEILAFKKNNTVVIAWKDKRVVLLLSTYHGAATAQSMRYKADGTTEEVTKPVAVLNYTAKMGGVDRADHYCASYNFSRKSKKWWHKVFFWILEVSIVNAYLLFNLVQEKKMATPVNDIFSNY